MNRAWEALVARSVKLTTRRLADRITGSDIREYNRIRLKWEDACKRSFGPLPATPQIAPRQISRDPDSAAA